MPITLKYRDVSPEEVPGAVSQFELLSGLKTSSYDRSAELEEAFAAPGSFTYDKAPVQETPVRPTEFDEPDFMRQRPVTQLPFQYGPEPTERVFQAAAFDPTPQTGEFREPTRLERQDYAKQFNVKAGLKELVTGFKRLPKATAASIASALQGYEGASVVDKDFGDSLVSKSKAEAAKAIAAASEKYGKVKWLPGIDMEDVVTLPSSLAHSLTAAAAGIVTGVGVAAITKNPFAGWAAGTAMAGTAAYQMTGYEVMKEYLTLKNEESQTKFGRPITAAEEKAFKKDFANTARKLGLWEAIPEAIGQATGLGIVFDKLVKIAGRPAAIRITSKLAAFYGEEEATEMATYIGQKNVRIAAGLDEGAPAGWDDPGTYAEAFKETFPQTFLLTTIMGGATVGGQSIYKNSNARKDAQIIKKAVAEKGYETLATGDLEQLLVNVRKTAKLRSGDKQLQKAVTELEQHVAERTGTAPAKELLPTAVEPTAPAVQTREVAQEAIPPAVTEYFQRVEPTAAPAIPLQEVPIEEQVQESTQSPAAVAAAEAAKAQGQFTEAEVGQVVPADIEERRQNTTMREAVRKLSTEAVASLFFTDTITGLGNQRALKALPEKKFKAFIDLDSLKWVNDNISHEAGDTLVKSAGTALNQTTAAADAYHLSGDEFALQADTREELEQAVVAAREYLAANLLNFEEGGTTFTLPTQFSYGIAETLKAADKAMAADKIAREKAGLRGVREGVPVGVTVQKTGPTTVQDRVDVVKALPAKPTTKVVPPKPAEVVSKAIPQKPEPTTLVVPQKPVEEGPKTKDESVPRTVKDIPTTPVKVDYEGHRKVSISVPKKVLRTVHEFISNVAEKADKYLGVISTRLKNIRPTLKYKVREVSFDTSRNYAADLKTVVPLFKLAAKRMSKDDHKDWSTARTNADGAKIRELVEKYGLVEEHAQFRKTFNKVRKEALDVGLDVEYLDNYWARIIKHPSRFLQKVYKMKEWDSISRKLKAYAAARDITVGELDTDVKADLIANLLLGLPIEVAEPGFTKARKIKVIPPELAEFYMDTDSAQVVYLHAMREAIEKRKFFGKIPAHVAKVRTKLRTAETQLLRAEQRGLDERAATLKSDAIKYKAYLAKFAAQNDFTEHIGAFINDLLIEDKLDPSDEVKLRKILMARFHSKRATGIMRAYKNLSYIDVMGGLDKALTQVGDLTWALYEGGVLATTDKAARALVNKSRIPREDVGIRRMAQEFEDPGALGAAVAAVFKATGLEKIDTTGKESLLGVAHDKYRKRAVNDVAALRSELEPMFNDPSKVDQVIEDLRNNIITRDIHFLVWNRLSDFQPISESEVPEGLLTAGNWDVFYMLKTFTIKQMDVYRNEVFQKLASPDKATKIQGMKNLVRLAFYFVAANAGADVLKDLLLGREIKWTDTLVDNLWRLGGLSRYITRTASREGIFTAAKEMILPPSRLIDNAFKDIVAFGDQTGLRTIESIPGIGSVYTWRWGRKSEAGRKIIRKAATEKARKTRKKNQKRVVRPRR